MLTISLVTIKLLLTQFLYWSFQFCNTSISIACPLHLICWRLFHWRLRRRGGIKTTPSCIASRLTRIKILTASPSYGVKLFNGAINNTVRWNRKSEIQDGFWINVVTCISAYIHDRPSNEIPMAKSNLRSRAPFNIWGLLGLAVTTFCWSYA